MTVDRSRAGSARDHDPERDLRRVSAGMAKLRTDVDAAAASAAAAADAAAADVVLTRIEDVAANTVLMNATGDSASPTASTVAGLSDLDTSDESRAFLLGGYQDGSIGKLSLASLRTLLGL